MELGIEQRRDVIALLCRVAWADGVVVGAERKRLHEVLQRLGKGAVTADELEQWLRNGPAQVNGSLPSEAKQLFIQEALGLISADQNIDPGEMTAMHDIINYYFTRISQLVVG